MLQSVQATVIENSSYWEYNGLESTKSVFKKKSLCVTPGIEAYLSISGAQGKKVCFSPFRWMRVEMPLLEKSPGRWFIAGKGCTGPQPRDHRKRGQLWSGWGRFLEKEDIKWWTWISLWVWTQHSGHPRLLPCGWWEAMDCGPRGRLHWAGWGDTCLPVAIQPFMYASAFRALWFLTLLLPPWIFPWILGQPQLLADSRKRVSIISTAKCWSRG